MQSPAQHLAQLARRPEDDIDLAEAALVIAKQEYPDLNVEVYLAQLDAIAARLKRRLPADSARSHIIGMLNHYLFNELGYTGNRASYYDPRNSFLNDVIERRTGIPITLCVVYMEVARRLGLALAGVSFPGHFLVKCVTDHGVIVLDPYNNGISLSETDLRDRLAQVSNEHSAQHAPLSLLLKSATKKETLVRLARNLKGVYSEAGKLEKAVGIVSLILAIMPDAAQEFRDRGMLYNRLECCRAALSDLRRYVELEPEAEDDEPVQTMISELSQKSRLLN